MTEKGCEDGSAQSLRLDVDPAFPAAEAAGVDVALAIKGLSALRAGFQTALMRLRFSA
jgi:hypothetical protein